MKRLAVLAALVLLSGPAAADARHDWYVVKASDGHAYAYDLADVENAYGVSVKSVALHVDERDGEAEYLFYIDCAAGRGTTFGLIGDKSMAWTEGGGNPARGGWDTIPEKGALSVAADVACLRHMTGATHAASQQDALETLQKLSN